MTREDVLSGVKFKWKGGVYTAYPDSKGESYGGYIHNRFGSYECNVYSYGPYAMHWFTYVMDKRVSGTINYKSLEPYVEAPQAVPA